MDGYEHGQPWMDGEGKRCRCRCCIVLGASCYYCCQVRMCVISHTQVGCLDHLPGLKAERSRRSAVRSSQAGFSESHLHDPELWLRKRCCVAQKPCLATKMPTARCECGSGRLPAVRGLSFCGSLHEGKPVPQVPSPHQATRWAKTCADRGADYRRAAIGQARR